MKKTLMMLSLTIFTALSINAQTTSLDIPDVPSSKVMEMHEALERSKEAFKEANKLEFKAVNTEKHKVNRADFWKKVENKKAEEHSENMIKRAVEAIFSLFR